MMKATRAALSRRWCDLSQQQLPTHHARSSRSHWRSTVAGQTTREGRNSPEWCSPPRKVITWRAAGRPEGVGGGVGVWAWVQ